MAGNKAPGFFGERPLPQFEVDPQVLRRRTRRDVLLFGTGAVAALAGAGSLLPQDTLTRLGLRRDMNSPGKEWLLNKALRIDDNVAETLYSPRRTVPTYTKSQVTPLKNNYNGATPDPGYIPGWHLTLDAARLGRESRPRYSQSHDSLLDTRADYAAGLRRRLERGRMVGWSEIRRFASCLPADVAGQMGAGGVISQSRCVGQS